MGREFDFVIFGATGFTGQYVVRELAQVDKDRKYKWAVAGRNEEKLKNVIADSEKELDMSLGHVGVILAEVTDDDSLEAMAAKATVVINCVGPYRLYGEPVVRACVKNGTSHVDISGEPLYLEGMQLKFAQEAEENKCYIVGACGWDSIPCDIGLTFMANNFPADINQAETYVEWQSGEEGYSIHYGTFESMIHGFGDNKSLPPIRRQIMPDRPKYAFKLYPRGNFFQSPDVDKWALPFMGSDKSVVNRTQYYMQHNRNKRPIQIQTYMCMQSFMSAVGLALWGVLFMLMASFQWGRDFMMKFPQQFTFGFFSHQGPTKEQMAHTRFTYWLYGKGWMRSVPINEEHFEPPSERIVVRVDGPDPGYVATCACIVAAAVTLVEDTDKLPDKGGVYTPGIAFGESNIVFRLKQRGVNFRVIENSLVKDFEEE